MQFVFFFNLEAVPKGLNRGSINSFPQDFIPFPRKWNWGFLRHRKAWQRSLGRLLISCPWSRDCHPKSCAEGNGWNICPAAPPVSCAALTGSYDRGGPLGQSGFRVLPPPPSPAGVLTLRCSTASMRGSPSHRLGFSCFSVLFCWFVFDFCLESWNVLGKLFLSKFISNPSTLFRAPAYLTPPASPCSSTVTTFFPSFQCPGEAGASRPRSVKSKSNGPPVKMASQAANPATLGKKQKESIFLCNGHPRRSLPVRGAFVSHQRGTKGNISFFF